MQEDDPEPLPGCFGCLGDTSMLAIFALALLLVGFSVQRSDAAVPAHPDDAVPPLQFCAPVAPSGGAPDIPPVEDIA